MKTILTTILFSLFSAILFAQNWNILNPEVTSYYSHSDSIHLTNTIKIDSTVVSGTSEISYISNKYKVCDTCDFNPNNEVIIHRYAKEFLGFGVEYDIERNVYVIEGDSLFAQSQIGSTWQFNDDLTATTTSIYTDSVIDQLDSLKIITLSSNDTIILSQNHGIIRYPDFGNTGKYYELKGYHNDEWYYGEVFPNFWSIYDFAVGDEYCGYHGYEYMNFDRFTKRIKIISIISIDSSEIIYETISAGSHYYGAFSIGEGDLGWSETSFFGPNYSTQSFFRYQGQNEDFFGIKVIGFSEDSEVNYPPYFQNFSGFINDMIPENFIVMKNQYSDEFGYEKSIQEFSPIGDSLLFSFVDEYDNLGVLKYANHLGCTNYIENYGFGRSYQGLRGAIIGIDTIGDMCTFSMYIGIESLSINPLSVYPNPANSRITLEGKYQALEIYSQTGQLVMKIEKPTSVIDVSELSPGIYFLKATNEEKLYTTKLIIE